MASMTDYMVLQSAQFELSDSPSGPGDVKILRFTPPPDFTVGTNLARPLLAYIVNPKSDTVVVRIWVNPDGLELTQSTAQESLSWHNAPRIDQALWDAIDGTKFEKGKENTVVFKAVDGRVSLRDIVLWYQRGSGD